MRTADRRLDKNTDKVNYDIR